MIEHSVLVTAHNTFSFRLSVAGHARFDDPPDVMEGREGAIVRLRELHYLLH